MRIDPENTCYTDPTVPAIRRDVLGRLLAGDVVLLQLLQVLVMHVSLLMSACRTLRQGRALFR